MTTKQKFVVLVAFLLAVTMCSTVVETVIMPHKTTGTLDMIQPNGWIPSRDGYYAGEVNQPNSEANLNNAQAQLAKAQATAVMQRSQAEILNGPASVAMNAAGSLGCGIGLGLGVVGILAVAWMRATRASDE